MLQPTIETERLIIREILPGDAEGMFEMDSDAEVHRFLGNNPIKTLDEAKAAIQFIQDQYTKNGIGRWAMIEKNTGNFVGWTGLKLVTEEINNHINYYDLGYRLVRKYWGNGYATESALASIDYGFNKMGLTEICAWADANHAASIKVLEKTGLKFIENFQFESVPHKWFSIQKIHI